METPALDRLDAAIARLERAVATHRSQSAGITRRHAALKAKMSEAVAALDRVIAREGDDAMAEPLGEEV